MRAFIKSYDRHSDSNIIHVAKCVNIENLGFTKRYVLVDSFGSKFSLNAKELKKAITSKRLRVTNIELDGAKLILKSNK